MNFKRKIKQYLEPVINWASLAGTASTTVKWPTRACDHPHSEPRHYYHPCRGMASRCLAHVGYRPTDNDHVKQV